MASDLNIFSPRIFCTNPSHSLTLLYLPSPPMEPRTLSQSTVISLLNGSLAITPWWRTGQRPRAMSTLIRSSSPPRLSSASSVVKDRHSVSLASWPEVQSLTFWAFRWICVLFLYQRAFYSSHDPASSNISLSMFRPTPLPTKSVRTRSFALNLSKTHNLPTRKIPISGLLITTGLCLLSPTPSLSVLLLPPP